MNQGRGSFFLSCVEIWAQAFHIGNIFEDGRWISQEIVSIWIELTSILIWNKVSSLSNPEMISCPNTRKNCSETNLMQRREKLQFSTSFCGLFANYKMF